MQSSEADEDVVDWEALFRALVSRNFKQVLEPVCACRSSPLLEYAKRWLDGVAQELASDISDDIRSATRPRGKGGEISPDWLVVVRGLTSDGNACVVEVKERGAEADARAAEKASRPVAVLGGVDDDEPPLVYQLLLSVGATGGTLFFISRPHPEAAAAFRALALNAQSFRTSLPEAGGRYDCVNVGTALSALYRAHSLCSLHKLQPSLRAALIPGYELAAEERERAHRSPWRKLEDAPTSSGIQLNAGQLAALRCMDGPVAVVQGPPGTGKSSFITEAFLRRVPQSAKVLGCTSTNKAIDSLVAKFEAAGVTEMLVVGSEDRVGDVSKRYLMHQRLSRDKIVAKAEAVLAKATLERELCEEAVAQAKKLRKPKKDSDGKEDNRGFVERQLAKIGNDKKEVKKTPGITRLLKIIEMDASGSFTNAKLHAACKAYLTKPLEGEDEKAMEELRAAKQKLKVAEKAEELAQAEVWRKKRGARVRIWKHARFVACTASSAAQVTRRLLRALTSESDSDDDAPASGLAASGALLFRCVILDEAGAMLEPDAIGTLLHGAESLLLVGDHHQLPPFSKWREGRQLGYDISLMERLATPAAARGAKSSVGQPLPVAMLEEQYRMHPAIGDAVSAAFYKGKLKTAAVTTAARRCPLPLCWVEGGGTESQPEGATSWSNEEEAAAAVRLVRFLVERGHPQSDVNVLTFYNGQRGIIASGLSKLGFHDVMVASVDSMQGREVDVVILSCVRTGSGRGGLGFLSDWRRANVAISRARECLAVLGTWKTVSQDRSWATALRNSKVFDNDALFRQEYQQRVPGVLGAAGSTRPAPATEAVPEAAAAKPQTIAESVHEHGAKVSTVLVPESWDDDADALPECWDDEEAAPQSAKCADDDLIVAAPATGTKFESDVNSSPKAVPEMWDDGGEPEQKHEPAEPLAASVNGEISNSDVKVQEKPGACPTQEEIRSSAPPADKADAKARKSKKEEQDEWAAGEKKDKKDKKSDKSDKDKKDVVEKKDKKDKKEMKEKKEKDDRGIKDEENRAAEMFALVVSGAGGATGRTLAEKLQARCKLFRQLCEKPSVQAKLLDVLLRHCCEASPTGWKEPVATLKEAEVLQASGHALWEEESFPTTVREVPHVGNTLKELAIMFKPD